MHRSHLHKTEDYVLSLLNERTPNHNTYHNLAHTKNVVQAALEIAIGEKLAPDDMEMVQIAAWFHDTGYVEKSAGHEEISAMYAGNFLSEAG
ncbi:MAG: HD domain-containing protein, partial [Melioribacteraceae bacterium]